MADAAMEEIKGVLQQFFTIDDELRDLSNDVREKKQERKDLLEKINGFLIERGLESLNTTNGSLQKKKKIKRAGISRGLLMTCLQDCEYVEGGEDVAEKIVKYIYDNRPSEEVEELKRIGS